MTTDTSSTSPAAETSSPRSAPALGVAAPLLYGMFFLTGACALIYEVLWTRRLLYVFGATVPAVSTVLAAFMGGLALGSALGGRIADRSRTPLKLYGIFEIGVGLAALAFPYLLQALDPLFRSLYHASSGNTAVYSFVRFLCCFSLLLIPTTLMGATLPALSRFVTSSADRVGAQIGALYAVNTAGAVIGTFSAGFLLLGTLGLATTNYLAVGVNLLVGVAATIVGGKITRDPESPAPAAESAKPAAGAGAADGSTAAALSPALARLILISYFLSGATALALQVVWTRSLVFSFELMKNTTYAFSGMLTVFLTGLAIGSAIITPRVDRERDPLRLYALLQGLIGLTSAFSFFMIHYVAPRVQPFAEVAAEGQILWYNAVLNVMLKTASSLALPTLLMGMAFPVVTRVVVRATGGVGKQVGRLYAANTIGAILGALGGGFVLIPLLGVTGALVLLSTIPVLVGAALLLAHPTMPARMRTVLAAGLLIGIAIVQVRIITTGARMPLQRMELGESLVYYEEGALATVSVVRDVRGTKTIHVDNVGVAGTDRILLTDQKSLAHTPVLLLKDPKAVLTVGFGSGGASYSYTTYERLKDIHCVEICSTVLRGAPFLTESNHGVLLPDATLRMPNGQAIDFSKVAGLGDRRNDSYALPGHRTFDPRFKVILDDARSYLRFTEMRYDSIATDCTDLRYKSNANLYDLGYFELCRDRLTPGGMVVVWMPLAGLHDDAFRCALRTFRVVFPHVTTWYFGNEPTHFALLIGTMEEQRYDYAEIKKRLLEKSVDTDLAELDLNNAEKILSSFVCDEKGMDKILGEGPINTENTPYLEFESPKYGYGNVPLQKNMGRLYEVMTPVSEHIDNADAATLARIDRLQSAAPIVFKGHDDFREQRFPESTLAYMKALEVGGPDPATTRLLDFRDLAATADNMRTADPASDDLKWLKGQWLTFHLANSFAIQKRWSDTVTALRPLIDLSRSVDIDKIPTDMRQLLARSNALAAYAYIASKLPESAKPHIDLARKLNPQMASLAALESSIATGAPLPAELP